MAIYEYRCEVDGPFDVTLPIGTAPSSIACPACAGKAGRVYTNPMVLSVPRPLVAALEHEEKTRYEPDIVTKLPPSHKKTPMARLTPQLAKLPRP
ncbi:MAG TPA: FmdB family zinc ribbon protein [Solirubrobacter sp.]|jgi:putative FmdB family regulatory protein|nr:FmdB family zinc ribbon protein [Solirubrobacter sp.]